MKYLLHGKLAAKENKTGELASILLEAAALIANAKGCHLYAISKDANDASAVWVTEVWDTKEDHDNSLSVPGVRELISKAMPILEGAPQKGQELELLGGHGI
ncbi:MAG: putative quinol monooxygenase [Niabella sp.]